MVRLRQRQISAVTPHDKRAPPIYTRRPNRWKLHLRSRAGYSKAGRNAVAFDRCPLDNATAHVAQNADFTLRLHRTLRPRLVHERVTAIYDALERPLIPVLRAMEAAGVVVDPRVLRTMSAHSVESTGHKRIFDDGRRSSRSHHG